jgi:DNA-binding winged helix-turn-helix (wHTH) protein/tetratricopeptide (TPR) repeat protein
MVRPVTSQLVKFGVFEVDLEAGELRKSGMRVKLAGQPFCALRVLLDHPNQIVSREELRQRLWPDSTVVDYELALKRIMNRVRSALGDTAESPRFIETIPRQGYRFIAPLIKEPDSQNNGTTLVNELESPAAAAQANHGERSRGKLLAIALLALPVLAVAGYLGLHRRPIRLTDRDTLVVAEFTNTTSDPVFDGTLRQGLSSQLEESPLLNLLSDQRIVQTLSLMRQPGNARLTPQLAREVCQRTGGTATIESSIANLGSQYVVGLKAVNCRTGDVLAEDQVTAGSKELVLKALAGGSGKLRERLGESLASVQRYGAPESVTTPSLEALQAYSLGYRAHIVSADYRLATTLYEKAIALDPNFAMAYARLGIAYNNLGQSVLAAENITRAYALRETVSEREKLYIVSRYEHFVTANLEKARDSYTFWAQTYPRDSDPWNNLGLINERLGDYENALTAYRAALQLTPGSGLSYSNLTRAFLNLNRLAEARAVAQDAKAHNLDPPYIPRWLYLAAFLDRDGAAMDREAAALLGKPGYEDQVLYLQSDTAAYFGQIAKARELTMKTIASAQHADKKESCAAYYANASVREAWLGNRATAKSFAQSALRLSDAKYVQSISALGLALIGDQEEAIRLAGELSRRSPEDTVVQSNFLPTIRAAIALQPGSTAHAQQAIQVLAAATPYEFGVPTNALYPAYLRGEAYLKASQGTAAVSEFEKIVQHPGAVQNELIGALARLQLGRAYLLSGEPAKAKAAYQDFLNLWKNADPELPLLKQAKVEYARLR